MNIAIIPARGGSKRIPRKNIRCFAGKPMIAFAIDAAKKCTKFDRIIVSTDDDEIADVAQAWGAEIFFKRPPDLADDHTPTIPVIAHAIRECELLGMTIDKVCCIYPCVPFLRVVDLLESLALLEKSSAIFSFPIAKFPSAVQRALRRRGDSTITPFFSSTQLARTQDLEELFYDAGQFYWGARDAWVEHSKIHSNGVGLVIPQNIAIDIDTEEDWVFAERMQKLLSI